MKTRAPRTMHGGSLRRLAGLWPLWILYGCLAGSQGTALRPVDPASQANQQCMQAKTPLQCREALPNCKQLAEQVEQLPDTRRMNNRKANVLGQLVFCEKELGQNLQAMEPARRILALQKNAHGPVHVLVATALNNLAAVLLNQEKYWEAEPLQREALAMRRKLLGKEHPAVAESLDNLAMVFEGQGKYGEAELVERQALAMRQKLLGIEHLAVAESLSNLGDVLYMQGKYEEAKPLYGEALAIRQKLLGIEHPTVADGLVRVAIVLEIQGKYEEAEPRFREILAMRQRLLGKEHPDAADSLHNLAGVLNSQGKYGEAEPLVREALALRQKLLGKEHPSVAGDLYMLSNVLYHQGKYGEAEPLAREALALFQKLLGKEHFDIAGSLHNLALIIDAQGKYEEAELLLRQTLIMRQKILGKEHNHVAADLHDLASVLMRQGKNGEAEPLVRESLAMACRLMGKQHPRVAKHLNTLALVLSSQGKDGEAEPLFREALTISRKPLGKENPTTAEILNNLALMLTSQGKDGEAEPLLRESLSMRQKLLGKEHPLVATSLNHLALLHLQAQRIEAAVPLLEQSSQIRESQLRAAVSETRVCALLQTLREEEDTVYGLLFNRSSLPEPKRLALQTALLRKGRAAEAGAAANRLLHESKSGPELSRLFNNWQSFRQQRESLLYGGPRTLQPADYQARLQELSISADTLEYQLADKLPVLRSLHPPRPGMIVAEVAKNLPKDGVLVEVLWVRPIQPWVRNDPSPRGTPRYVALLLFSDQRIEVQDLGEAAAIESESRTLVSALASPRSNPIGPAGALYKRVLAPLMSQLSGIQHLYLSLDGILNLVPFDALHDGKDYLLGHYRIHYLTSGRDLLRKTSERIAQPPLLLANPDFGRAPESKTAGKNCTLSLYQRLGTFGPLPGTEIEAENLRTLLGVTPLVGLAATEERVRAALAPWIVHFATHGVFFGDRELPGAQDPGLRSLSLLEPERGVKNIGKLTADDLTVPGSPFALSQSALILAGAALGQSAVSADKDGLLTAEEARSLDLDGTQLVVLSACQTGQGTLSAGQGVYGLRRSFLVAGAETLVSSLWRVDDTATGELMLSYYRKLLDENKPGDRVGAMQEAMIEMRATKGRSHPYYWAPFVVVGQDGPLRRPVSSWSGP